MPLNIADEIEQEEPTMNDLERKLNVFGLVIGALMNRNGYDGSVITSAELGVLLGDPDKYALCIEASEEGLFVSRPYLNEAFQGNAPSSEEIQ